MKLRVTSYDRQQRTWPAHGRAILAQFDDQDIVVYQAYNPAIAQFAVNNGRFGGGFSFSRMSWIKPGFLWMMFRSGWATKENQERVLVITLKRTGFDAILSQAVFSTFDPDLHESQDAWKKARKDSDVRLQWDPDHDPRGNPLERRALQLGLRGQALRSYANDWTVDIDDITDFVHEQAIVAASPKSDELVTPIEELYPVTRQVAVRIGLDR
jgi:hypothetical protein